MPHRPHRLAVSALCVLCAALPAPPAPNARHSVAPALDPAAAAEIDAFVVHEMRQKDLPGLAVALVHDQQIIWSKNYGTTRDRDTVRLTPNTVYRVGAISQIITDIAIEQLAERRRLDLDAPVSRYAPQLRLGVSARVTLRDLMTHRAGLDREPPAGGTADDHPPSLAAVAASLDSSPPLLTSRSTHPSDAGMALAGYVIEATQHEPFARYVRRTVLAPLGMAHATFARDGDVVAHVARGELWTYDPRTFPAPTFDLGVAPAENLYATVGDLAHLMSAIFADGRDPDARALSPGVVAGLTAAAAASDTARTTLGFRLTTLDGRPEIEQDGAVGGFSARIAALPADKLGVVVIATIDGANAVTMRVARLALRAARASMHRSPAPPIDTTAPVPAVLAESLAGRYAHGDRAVDFVRSMGHLYLERADGGERADLHVLRDTLVADGRLSYGARIVRLGDSTVVIDGDTLRRVAEPEPQPVPGAWRGVIGEYGPDFHTIYVLERHGALQLLADWFVRYPLRPVSADTFAMPGWGAYANERVVFTRAATAPHRALRLTLGGVSYARRVTGPEDGSQFRITPLRPTAELRTEALAATPPHENGTFRAPDLVELVTLDSTIKLDIRYATSNNFMGTPLYADARAFM